MTILLFFSKFQQNIKQNKTKQKDKFYKLSFYCFYSNTIACIITLIPQIQNPISRIATLIPCILTQISRIPDPFLTIPSFLASSLLFFACLFVCLFVCLINLIDVGVINYKLQINSGYQ